MSNLETMLWVDALLDPDGVSKLYVYNGNGEMEYTVLDLNQDHVIDWSGSAQIMRTVTDYTTSSAALASKPVRRTRSYVFDTATSTPTQVGEDCG